MHKPTVGVAIITHNAKHHLKHCLPPLLNSPLNPRVLVINSSSQDGTVEEAQRLGAETLVIERKKFNHGLTRETARQHLNTDIIVMMTPDAYATEGMLEHLTAPIIEKKAAAAYARQIPHQDAGIFESFPRYFNYPSESHLRSIQDVERYGIYSIFCSNSCAAYSNKALNTIGGFSEVLIGEDTLAIAKLLKNGERIAYVSEACVRHSHAYSLTQEFARHFDTGLARQSYRDQIAFAGQDTIRGQTYAKELLQQVTKEKPLLLPYAFLHIFAKWAGYKLGTASMKAPRWFKKSLSSQDFYW